MLLPVERDGCLSTGASLRKGDHYLKTKRSRITQRTYPTKERAMLAAFDAMIFYLDTR